MCGSDLFDEHVQCRWWMGYDHTNNKSTLVQDGLEQAITWANVDPDLRHHMASLTHNELNCPLLHSPWVHAAEIWNTSNR